MINSDGRKRRQLTPEEKWQVFLEVCSQQLTQADSARKWGVDVSTVIKLRRLAKDGALAAFAASKPGRPLSVERVELEACRAECARLTETRSRSRRSSWRCCGEDSARALRPGPCSTERRDQARAAGPGG